MSNLFDRVGMNIFDGKETRHQKPVINKYDYALNGFQLRPKEKEVKIDKVVRRKTKSIEKQQDDIDEDAVQIAAQVATLAKQSNGFKAIKSNQKTYIKSLDTLRQHAKAPGNTNRHAGLFASGFNRWRLLEESGKAAGKVPDHELGEPVDGMNAPKTKQLKDTRS
jgi:hypothetical protein